MAANKVRKPSKEDRADLRMVNAMIGNAITNDASVKQIQNVITNAKDMPGAIAQVAYHIVSTVIGKVRERALKISPKIWVAHGGVVDTTIKEIVQIAAGTMNRADLLNPKLLLQTRQDVLQLLHHEEEDAGGAGMDHQPAEQAAEDPSQGMSPEQEQQLPPQGGGLLAAGG